MPDFEAARDPLIGGVLVVQKRLRHSNPSVTLIIYGALSPGVDEAAADKLTVWVVKLFRALSVHQEDQRTLIL